MKDLQGFDLIRILDERLERITGETVLPMPTLVPYYRPLLSSVDFVIFSALMFAELVEAPKDRDKIPTANVVLKVYDGENEIREYEFSQFKNEMGEFLTDRGLTSIDRCETLSQAIFLFISSTIMGGLKEIANQAPKTETDLSDCIKHVLDKPGQLINNISDKKFIAEFINEEPVFMLSPITLLNPEVELRVAVDRYNSKHFMEELSTLCGVLPGRIIKLADNVFAARYIFT